MIRALCDEDCDLVAKATLVIKGGGKASSAKRKRKNGRGITAVPVSTRLQLGQKTRLSLDLSKKKTKRIRKALSGGRKVVAKIEASATGGGGGTTTVKKKAKLTKLKRKGK